MSILDCFTGRIWPPLTREHAVKVQEIPGAVIEDRQKSADYRTAGARRRMMCRFASFAVPLAQQLKSSEFVRKNAVFNVYRDYPARPGKGPADPGAARAPGGRGAQRARRCRCGRVVGATAVVRLVSRAGQ